MAQDHEPFTYTEAQSSKPHGFPVHCCDCYKKSMELDRHRSDVLERADAFMRALEILELDTEKCSKALHDEAERVVIAELRRQYPNSSALPVPRFS